MRIKTQSILLYFDAQPPLLRYSLAILAVVIATIATHTIPVIGEHAAFLIFVFAIIHSTFWLGVNPGLLTMMFSLLAVNTLVLSPSRISEPYDAVILNVGFCVLSAVIVATTSIHRRLTAELWESRQDLDHAQAVGQIGSWRLNVQRNELRWSDENHRIFGIAKGTPLTYETFLSTVHPNDREYVDRMWQKSLCGEPYDIEHRLIVAGEVKWVREKAVLEFSNNGVLLGGFGTTQDISDHKRNELALLESRQRYAGIVESAMDAIITIDADHRILLFNTAAENMFGCTADKAIGLPIECFIPERLRSADNPHINAFDISGTSNKTDNILGLRTNGDQFSIEASISRCEIDGKKSFTAILRDVTERVQTESALKEQLRLQDQLTKIAATVPGVICSFRLRTDGSTCMPYASPVFESVYGLSPDTVAEDCSPVLARIHPDDADHVNKTIAESARSLQPWRDSFRYKHPKKGEIWLEGHSMPLREKDGSVLWHGYLQDVTERKITEEELQERIARYELVLDGAQDAIWDWDVPNKRVHFSSRWKALRGFAEDEVGNDETEWSSAIHPDDSARVFAAVQSHFEEKTPVFCEEYRVRCKDGSWKWILDRGIAQKNTSGQVIRMAGSESDITDRKRAEMALQDREGELRLIMDVTPALIAYVSTDFRYLRVNAAYETWFGITAERMLGHKIQDIIGEKAWNTIRPYFEQVLAGEQANFDLTIPYGGAKPRWVHVSYIPHQDSAGNIKGIVVHIVDIEERKLAEEALREREEFVRGVLNSLPEHVVVLDNAGVVSTVNEPWERFAIENGGSPGEISVGANYLDVCRKAAAGNLYAHEALAGLEDLLAGHRQEFVMEYPCPTPDRKRWFLMYAKRVLHNPKGVILSHVDITEHKRAEEELRETQARLALVIEEVKAGYWDWDLITRTLYLSPEWKQQIGFDENELPNQWEEWECRLHPDDRALVLATTENYIAGRQMVFDLEFRLRHKDGSYRWIHSRGGLLRDQNNQPYRMLGINLDISDYVKTKELSERRNKIEQSFRLHVALQTAAAIAHELNQPLTAISSYADVAQQLLQIGNPNPQKLSHVIENCALQAQRAGQVIRQLLTLLQKGETISEPLDVNSSVRKALDFVNADGYLGAFKIHLDLAADLPPVAANGLQIQKVLINLLRNSIESMRENEITAGTITVTTRRPSGDPAIAQVTVCDCGKGVADSTCLRTMFQPFYTTKSTGLGMGLAISRTLIEAHDGKIWAEQNAGSGISVHFTLPFVI